MLQVLPRY